MAHQHDHAHHHHHGTAPMTNVNRALIIGAILNTLYVVVEFSLGLYYNSLALIADANPALRLTYRSTRRVIICSNRAHTAIKESALRLFRFSGFLTLLCLPFFFLALGLFSGALLLYLSLAKLFKFPLSFCCTVFLLL